VDLHEWYSARHSAPEITTSAGYDWSMSPPSARKYRALNDRVARPVAAYGRAGQLKMADLNLADWKRTQGGKWQT